MLRYIKFYIKQNRNFLTIELLNYRTGGIFMESVKALVNKNFINLFFGRNDINNE